MKFVAKFFLQLVPLIFLLESIASEFVLDLNGDWIVQSSRKGAEQCAARVPGNVYSDLLRNGTLKEDAYYRFNDEGYRWVSKEDWTFTRSFRFSDDLRQYSRVLLRCDGVDTIAAIYVNNKLVGTTDNQFVQYFFDVKDALNFTSTNDITFRFKSPTIYATDQFNKHIIDRGYIVPPVCPPPEFHGECHPQFIRKSQHSFSWDWGPAFPTVGIWRNISLVAYNRAYLEGVIVNTSWIHTTDQWNITLIVHLLTTGNSQPGIIITEIPELGLKVAENIVLNAERSNFTFTYGIPSKVEKWWPNGYGNQKLYELKVTFLNNNDQETSVKNVKVGFRTVELVQDNLPKSNVTGLTFYFRVNNVPIYSKGSNWIPAHIFQDQATNEYVEWLLRSSIAANMNMLRVWGGGYYESDYFYQLCDELGILIWQDFMFACAMYPTTDEFLVSVRQEVRGNILRLQHHPSILIWAGNNENEAALQTNWYNTNIAYDTFKKDYLTLYIDVIRDESLKMEIEGSRPWVSSSPSDGKLTEQEGWLAKDPYSNLYGDVHYYNYMVNPWDWTVYPATRFASEYGYQSWESMETLQPYALPSDLSYSSVFAIHRQHHPMGETEMLFEISKNFKLPEPIISTEKFPAMIYLTQINQAMGLKTETEYYRRLQSIINPDSSGFTKGALYWQLNSIWPCPSWASIEFGGKWKMAHYYAKDFFEPVLLSPYVDKKDGNFHIILINDRLENINAEMRMLIFGYSSFVTKSTVSVKVSQGPQTAMEVYKEAVDKLLARNNCTHSADCFAVVFLSMASGALLSNPNFYFFGPPKEATIPKTELTISSVLPVDTSNRVFNITLEAANPAPFVWMEALNIRGYFSRNGHIQFLPSENITFYSDKIISADALKRSLRVMSLMDIY